MKVDRNAFSEVFMIPVSSAISSGLTWSKVSRNRSYELKLNDEIVGTLQHPGFFSSDFLAKTEDGQWTFRRAGLLGAGTQILDSASHQQLAMFKSVWGGGGDLTFADGATFHLTCKGSWRPVWTMIGAERQPVLHVHVREKTVDVLATGIPASRLSLLIMFTWYRMLQAEEDAASAAMVAVMVAL
jgi:hypothetical protein